MPYTDVELRPLADEQIAAAARLLAEAMADNPTHVAVFGARPGPRRRLRRFFRAMLSHVQRHGVLVGACERDGALVGVMGALRPGGCRSAGLQRLALGLRLVLGLRLALGLRPDVLLRTLRWLLAWQARDPARAHWHLGPLAVRPDRRGQGLGARLLQDALQRAEPSGLASYLETDLPRNVAWYRRCGFEVVAESSVLGLSHWFMQRAPHASRNA
ncbi:MAG TPA: GNAT family N-acetyltransferase [Ottowia sp.]|uniref:GNAT family N-acetyltransferase n=1 Tax=Ottowia sp. TaxID=1898956 RepID=UPI002CB566F8|nr:GNAT family N-acetyltransferase [Ottowia sp.]HMN22094.1 GNAT family N-acetyltransferase [Ottowia sp.]